MSGLARAWGWWVALLDRRGPADALAWFRILSGLAALYAIVSVVWADIVALTWLDASHGGYMHIDGDTWIVALFGGPTPAVVWSLVIAAIVGSVAVTLGGGGRMSPLVTGQVLLALRDLNPMVGSYGTITLNALWLLVLSSSTATLSIDCRLRNGRWRSDEQVPQWPMLLVVVQLALVYFCNGIAKISAHWVPGGDLSAIYYILQQPTWQRVDMLWIAWVYPLTQAATAITWLFELSWPLVLVALWLRRTAGRGGRLRRIANRIDVRKVVLVIGLAFHGLIAISLDVGPFLLATMAFYPCMFEAHELRAAARRAATLLRLRPRVLDSRRRA
jgi:hypothetical protein